MPKLSKTISLALLPCFFTEDFRSFLLYVPLSFLALAFVINLFFILLSGHSAVGNMSVGGFKPYVLGELELESCFNLGIYDILSWKATEVARSV